MLKNIKLYFKYKYEDFRFYLSGKNHFAFRIFYKYFYRSQANGLDAFINQLSNNHEGDFYVVQIGANDGMINDPLHKYIKRDHWKGVLLEPQKMVFEQRLKKLYANDQGIITLNAALGKKDGEAILYKIGFCSDRWAHGLASFNKEQVENLFRSGKIKQLATKYNVTIPEQKEEQIIEELVDVISSNTLLEKYPMPKIDLLQIDTEGFDFEIIKMFNLKKHKPLHIIYEHEHLTKSDQILCETFLKDHQYQISNFGADSLALYRGIQ